MDEQIREKEMARIQAKSDEKREEEARMIAKLNGSWGYLDDMPEEVFHKRR